MKKKLLCLMIALSCVCMVILLFFNRKESNSKKWDGTESQEVISDYERLYSCNYEAVLFILADDAIILEKNGSYWELEKVGEVKMTSDFLNMPAVQQ